MDPMTLAAVGAVVGGGMLLKLVTPALRRSVARSRTRELARHRLAVVEGPHGASWIDATGQAPPLTAHVDNGEIVVVAAHTWLVSRTRFFWARRHEGALANEMRQAPAFTGQFEDPLTGTVARWREIADECFIGGVPQEAIDAIADDDDVARAVAALLKEPAQMAATLEELIFRFPRGPETIEKEIRRALDVARAVVVTLDARARLLKDLDAEQLVLDETAVSSASGSPFAVRSIDP